MKKNESEGAEEERRTEDPLVNADETSSEEPERERDRYARYQQSSLEEVSDDEYWRFIHHGKPEDDEEASAHRAYSDAHMESMMRETNDVLNARIRRLKAEYERAGVQNNHMAMEAIDLQILEAQHLLYNI